ncbi:MAG TPA: hypothetical protein VET89_06145 [Stellaceae bacterium]|jgi:Na+/phosphate symporter|nr:hypothetical protein [Stellaceae bacterium]
MLPQDILGLIVRLFGLFVMVYGIYSVFYALFQILGVAPEATSPAWRHALFGLVHYALGFLVVRTAKRIAAFAYRGDA